MSPFFSIILPTRNRSDIVIHAIESVQRQTFADWELIVVDNDETDATAIAVRPYVNSKIHYYRTGNLSMCDNWEFGLHKTKGQYISVLQDKATLFHDSLAIIAQAISDFSKPIVSWNYSFVHKEKNIEKLMLNKQFTRSIYTTEEVLQLFLSHGDYHFSRVIPRFVNSCCERSIIEKAMNTSVGRVFPPISPDYTSMFLQLYLYSELLYIDKVLTLFDNRKYSGGAVYAAKRKDSAEYKDVMKMVINQNENQLCDLVPVNAPNIGYNHMMNDYLHLREQLGGKFSYYPMDKINYYNECFHFIELSEALGAEMNTERDMVHVALQKECGNIQKSVYDLREKIGVWQQYKDESLKK